MSVATILPNLAHLATDMATGRGGNPALSWAEYRHIVETAIADQPRTLQTRIGPSELGTDCTLCLVRKLAGIPEARDVAWLPWVGSAVHAQLEDVFTSWNAKAPAVRFLVETTVSVGEVDGQDITGHADLYDLVTAEVTDWKVVGKTTLTAAKSKGPSQVYRRQAHLYGRGFTRRGLPVDRVRIAYLPRNEPTLANAIVWDEPYDEAIALQTLARADALAKAIRLVGADQVIAGQTGAPGCFSCPRFDPSIKKPGHEHQPDRQLQGLIA